jgi:hypothetical protein
MSRLRRKAEPMTKASTPIFQQAVDGRFRLADHQRNVGQAHAFRHLAEGGENVDRLVERLGRRAREIAAGEFALRPAFPAASRHACHPFAVSIAGRPGNDKECGSRSAIS